MLEFKVFNKFDKECRNIFDKLTRNSNFNFFQNYDYLESLSLENKTEIKIIAIYSNNEIIAILPLEIKRYFIFKILQWIGTGRSDFCNPIVIKKFETFINGENFLLIWKKILDKVGNYDLIFLNNQISQIEEASNPFTKYLDAVEFSKLYQIKLPNNFQSYLDSQKNKDKKKYYEIHRTLIKSKKLEEKFSVSFSIKKMSDDDIAFSDIIKNKRRQLELRKIRHNLDQTFIQVFEKLIRRNDSNYFISNLKIENEVVSSCFGILSNNTFHYFIPMMRSNNYSYFKPGKILTLKIIDWCIQNNIKNFDFGLGDEKYKENFSNQILSLHRFIRHKTLMGKILLFGMKILYFNKRLK